MPIHRLDLRYSNVLTYYTSYPPELGRRHMAHWPSAPQAIPETVPQPIIISK